MPTDLRITTMSDRELCLSLKDAADNEGYASTGEIADMLNMSAQNAKLCISSRLARMAGEIALVERHPEERGMWRLTEDGEALANGTLRKRFEETVGRLSDAEKVVLMGRVAQDTLVRGPRRVGLRAKREFTYNVAQMNGGRRRNGR